MLIKHVNITARLESADLNSNMSYLLPQLILQGPICFLLQPRPVCTSRVIPNSDNSDSERSSKVEARGVDVPLILLGLTSSLERPDEELSF